MTLPTTTFKSWLVPVGLHGQIAYHKQLLPYHWSFTLSFLSIIRHGQAKSFKNITRFYLFVYICLAKNISFYDSCTNNQPQHNLAITEACELYLMLMCIQIHINDIYYTTTHKFWTVSSFPKHSLIHTWNYSANHQWRPPLQNFLIN